MIKRLGLAGCLVMVAALGLVAAMLHAMGLTRYVVLYFQVLFNLATNPENDAAIWTKTDAEVMNITLQTDANYRDLARIVLRYPDSNGRERVRTFDVFSPSRGLGRISKGDRLVLEVCRQDPAIIKAREFLLSQAGKCAEEAQ